MSVSLSQYISFSHMIQRMKRRSAHSAIGLSAYLNQQFAVVIEFSICKRFSLINVM
jgi:hypothetical protein